MIKRELYLEMRWFAWLCGLLEGEGTFPGGTPSAPRRPRVGLVMTDHDVVERVAELLGTRVYRHTRVHTNPNHTPARRTELVGGSAVALMELLRPHMSQRRQAQIAAAITSFRPLRPILHKHFYLLPAGQAEFDRYWLAGYLEGEGSFGWSKSAGSPLLEVNSIDRDVIERCHALYRTRYGVCINIHTRPPRRAGYLPQYHLAVYGAAARSIMGDIYALMSARRCVRIDELLGPVRQPRLMREDRVMMYLKQESGFRSQEPGGLAVLTRSPAHPVIFSGAQQWPV